MKLADCSEHPEHFVRKELSSRMAHSFFKESCNSLASFFPSATGIQPTSSSRQPSSYLRVRLIAGAVLAMVTLSSCIPNFSLSLNDWIGQNENIQNSPLSAEEQDHPASSQLEINGHQRSEVKNSDSASLNTLNDSPKQDTHPTDNQLNRDSVLKDSSYGPWISPAVSKLEPVDGHHAEIIGLFSPSPIFRSGQVPEISIDSSGEVFLWDLSSTGVGRIMRVPGPVQLAAFCQEKGFLAVTNGVGLKIFSLSERKEFSRLDKIRTRISSLAFQPGCESIVMGGTDGVVYRWKYFQALSADTMRDQELSLEKYVGHSVLVSSVVFHPFGRFFFSGDWRGKISAWLTYDNDIFQGAYDENIFKGGIFAQGSTRTSVEANKADPVVRIVVSADGESFCVALQSGTIQWWDVRGIKKHAEVSAAHTGLIYDLAISADGTKLVSVGRDGKVKTWSLVPSPDKKTSASITLGKEMLLPEARKVVFAEKDIILAGAIDGRVLSLDLQ